MPIKEICEYFSLSLVEFFNLVRPEQMKLIKRYYDEQKLAKYILE